MQSQMLYKFLFGGSIIVLLLSGCAATSRITNLSPAYLYSKPTVSSYKNPEVKINAYQTFSVFPQSLISENTEMNEILEKQMLFFLRNQLEAKGYKFVELNQQPDFLASVSVSTKYESSYIPPETVTLPQLVPGQTVTTYGTSSATFSYNNYSSYSTYGWGTYSSSYTSTTYIPGYITTKTYTRLGYSVGHYYPAAEISIYDGKTLECLWIGTGVGTSDNADVRVSSQLVISRIFAELPDALTPYRFQLNKGALGVSLGIFTNDGNNYVPTVVNVAKSSPAQKAGIHQYDMILAVDGVSVINKPFRDIFELFGGNPGSDIQLDVWRTGQKFSLKLTRTTLESIQW